jgi:hypothetical protein
MLNLLSTLVRGAAARAAEDLHDQHAFLILEPARAAAPRTRVERRLSIVGSGSVNVVHEGTFPQL